MEIPEPVTRTIETLKESNYEAYIVGGCVRDVLLNRAPKDWDITTNATPEQIQEVFPESRYENTFGTVIIKNETDDPTLQLIEITTYRIDASYSDGRHPDHITFTASLEEDLARRDFTVNAMAMDEKNQVIDPYEGQNDLKLKLIRAVGDPSKRFEEDALRMMRAVRFASQLDFTIEGKTLEAIKSHASTIEKVSMERIRDEINKILLSDHPETGFNTLQQAGLLKRVLPELEEGVGVGQNKHHIYTVYEHCVKSAQYAAKYDYSLEVRLAALLHDIGKPRTKRPKDGDFTFYGHEVVGMHMTRKALTRLRYPAETIKKVAHLVRSHMFYYDVGKVSEAGARRLLRRVGEEHWQDVINVRIAERKGSGVPKAEPYRLRHLQFLVEKSSRAPITTSQLAIDGNTLMKELGLKPGPQIGGILNALLADVLDEPAHNTREYLMERAAELMNTDPKELKRMGERAKDEAEAAKDAEIKRKYHV